MSYFDDAMEFVLKHEGGFSNHPKDKGGATNYGISLKYLKGIGIDVNGDGSLDIIDIEDLSKGEAKEIYKEHFWDKYHYFKINNLLIARKVFDMSVNMGPKMSHKLLQRALNTLNTNGATKLLIDGIFGQKTIDALEHVLERGNESSLLILLREESVAYYDRLIMIYPDLKVFRRGWLNRAKA